ncbi:MAG: TIM-barrel domain-containing protein [Actinomycetota bacterium]
MSAQEGAATHHILRTAEVVGIGPSGADLDVAALPAIGLPGTPGWLTGEPLLDQGIEVDMPNLPADLPLPPVDEVRFRCRVEVVGPRAVRVTIAPAGARVFDEPATWLGIVTEPAIGDTSAAIEEADGRLLVKTQELLLSIGLSPFRIRVGDDDRPALRTAERLRQVAGFPMAPPVRVSRDGAGRTRTVLNLELEAHEQILGFGEWFSRVVKNGQRLSLRAEDALGTGTGLAYKPAPVWLSTAGYLGLLNTGATVEVDAGHVRPSVLSLDVDDEAIDLYLVAAPTPAEQLADYTTLTGRGARPPLWAFGYWMGRCRYHGADQMLAVADGMRSRRIPLDVLHADPDWLVVDRLNTDFIWNTERFGELPDFVDALAERDTRLSIWEVPYLDPVSPRYEVAEHAGHLLRSADGGVAELRGTPTPDGRPRGLVDVTDPGGRRWWQDLHREFLDAGVAVFKTDFGEGCPDDAVSRDGTPSNHLHNLYPLKYNAAVSEVIASSTGRAPLVWGRSGWAGSHRYPGQWGGDAESTVAGLQATLRGGLSHAVSNPGFWSHDIGGFFGPELTPGLYVRWTQFGALSPLMRAHGLRPREPWEFGEEALEICRRWIRLRYSLVPYLWQVAGEVERSGLPMLRPMVLEFPDDPFAPGTDDQYLLGSDLLVVPVLDDAMRTVTRRVYLPAGRWHRLDTGAAGGADPDPIEGPQLVWVDVPIDDMPVYVRDGATIPTVGVDDAVRSTGDLVDRPWTLHLYGTDRPAELDGFGSAAPEIGEVLRHG